MLLSDANLNFCSPRSKNARMRFHQKSKLFIDHLYEKMTLNNLVRAKPHLSKQIDKKYNKIRESYKFNTLTFPYFTEIYPTWYTKINNKNIKIVPPNISDLLTPRAIAYWLMGDGSYIKASGRISFATHSFSINEIELLQNVLLAKYNINSNRYAANSSQYVIYIPRKDAINLAMLVYPYLIESMHYKIGL
jgi:hypothetical protein